MKKEGGYIWPAVGHNRVIIIIERNQGPSLGLIASWYFQVSVLDLNHIKNNWFYQKMYYDYEDKT